MSRRGVAPMPQPARRQRGLSLLGLLFWGALIAMAAVVGAKVTPTVMEYYTIKRAVDTIARGNPATVAQAKGEFERIKQVEYSIQLSGNDLEVTKVNDRVKIHFAYSREVALGGPVYLLLKYEGQSN
ncbi:MAG: DUF4845 domain-containing protein [Burkholderiales bacterium]|nr:DUF4845 domain-containing protein [Burkholderiales bacterium]